MKISLLTPTRKRPNQMKRLWKSAVKTAYDTSLLEIVFYIDEDDVGSIEMYNKMKSNAAVKAVIGKRLILSQAWNVAYEHASGELFMHCGDDIVFKSKQWDKIVRSYFEKSPDKILFVFGKDGIWDNDKLGTHGFLHKNWVETIGYFVPPYFDYGGNDGWLTEVATALGRKRFIKEIDIEHMHYSIGKAKKDRTYKEQSVRHKERYGGKVGAIKLWADTKEERLQDVEKLKLFIENFERKL